MSDNMDERPNLHEFLNQVSSFQDEEAGTPAAPTKAVGPAPGPIGQVVEIAGSGSQIRLDAATVTAHHRATLHHDVRGRRLLLLIG